MILTNEPNIQTFEMPKEWTYRGEGNCNIVISLPKSRKILRIRKMEKPKSILGWILVLISDFLYWYYGKGLSDELRDLNFYTKIMRPLLGNKYTSEAKQVFLKRKQAHIFKDELSKIRPEYRQNKTLQYGRAAIFDDFAFLPKHYDELPVQFSENTFSVEIKPKQGWRPLKEQFFPQCFFCMNQFLKLEKKQIRCVTKYCPEDLFSGDKIKMKLALKHLYEIPQNNFRVFKNGVLLYDEKHKNKYVLQDIFECLDSEESLKDELCDFLQKCLLADLTDSDNDCFNRDICDCNGSFSAVISTNNLAGENNLPQGSVLERILSIQMLDNEGSHSTYKKLSKSDDWDNWSFVDRLLEVIENNGNTCINCSIVKMSRICENELLFVPYLVSAIAKDCSLMVTFKKLLGNPCENLNLKNVFKTKYGYYMVNIGVFDLYPKPLSTVQKHYRRNKDMLKAFKKGGMGKHC